MRKLAAILILGLLSSLANAALMPAGTPKTSDASGSIVQAAHQPCHSQDKADDPHNQSLHTVSVGHGCCVLTALQAAPQIQHMDIARPIYSLDLAHEPRLEVFSSIFKPPRAIL